MMEGALLPFSREQFFDLFAVYNTAIWPAQIVGGAIAIGAIAMLWFRLKPAAPIILCGLALLWVWTGSVYHILFFSRINGAAAWFGALFVVQAFLLVVFAWRGSVEVSRDALGNVMAWTILCYAVLLYPLINAWSGHWYPAAPTFGVTPCPLVIFTFGALLFTTKRAPWSFFVVPLFWSVVGGSAAFLLGVHSDSALPISAVIATVQNAQKDTA